VLYIIRWTRTQGRRGKGDAEASEIVQSLGYFREEEEE